MLLYADENFDYPVVIELRAMGHDVLTAQDDKHRQSPDSVILARAHALARVVVTFNAWDYGHLHLQRADHSGIVCATHDVDANALARRIDAALAGKAPGRWFLRVTRPTNP
jgi:hypothetical protein